MEIISRKDAETALMKHYFTGNPCKRGHLSVRRTADSMCIECLRVLAERPEFREKAKARSSEWYAENRERALSRPRDKKAIALKDAKYRARNKNRITVAQAKYRREKREQLAAKGRRSYATIGGNRWINCMVTAAKKRATKAGVAFDEMAVRQYLSMPSKVCPVFGIEFQIGAKAMTDAAPTLDRVIPAKGYVDGNIALISWRANRLKSNARSEDLRAVADWMDSVKPMQVMTVKGVELGDIFTGKQIVALINEAARRPEL